MAVTELATVTVICNTCGTPFEAEVRTDWFVDNDGHTEIEHIWDEEAVCPKCESDDFWEVGK